MICPICHGSGGRTLFPPCPECQGSGVVHCCEGMMATPEADDVDVNEVEALVEALSKVIAGKPAVIQGAALADMLAMWIAGHFVPDDPEGTKKVRDAILRHHIDGVESLIEVNAKQLGIR